MKKLRDYQIDCLCALEKSFLKSKKHLVVLPTGAGKTFTICNFLKGKNEKTLLLSHTREINIQITNELNNVLGCHEHMALTIQAASRNLNKLKRENFGIIIIDECHRAAADSYVKIVNHLKNDNTHIIGITATPFRSDKKSLREILGLPIYKLSIIDLIERGYLCDYVGYRIKTNVSLKGVSTKSGDFQSCRLEPVINVKNRNKLILDQYLKLEKGDKTIVFCVNLKHANALHKLFLENKVSCGIIHGKLPVKNRDETLQKFKTGEINLIFNCMVLTEGFDEPSINTIFLCRPTLSKGLYIQMIGRGARLFPNKKQCKVYEFTDNEYDVCQMEDILEAPLRKIPMKKGETLTDYSRRIKELLDDGIEIIKEDLQIVRKNFYEKEATIWQLQKLKEKGIKFKIPLTEHAANNLLWG